MRLNRAQWVIIAFTVVLSLAIGLAVSCRANQPPLAPLVTRTVTPRVTLTPLPTYTPGPTYTANPTYTARPNSPRISTAVLDDHPTEIFTPNPSTLITPPALPIGGGTGKPVWVLVIIFGFGLTTVGAVWYLWTANK